MLPTAAPVGTHPGSVQGRRGAGSRVLTQQASAQELLGVCTGWRAGAGSDLRNTSVQVQDCGPANHSLPTLRKLRCCVPLGFGCPASPPPDPLRSQLGLRAESGQSASPSMCPPSFPWIKSIPRQSEKTPAWPLAVHSVTTGQRPPQRGRVRGGGPVQAT